MPTNLLRSRTPKPTVAAGPKVVAGVRRALIQAGAGISIRIELADTPTAARIWAALPLHATAERWGDSVHFEIPVRSGRDRTARFNARAGDICFWSDDHRVIIGFGPTPISMPHEIRLMSPSNVWARAIDDVRALAAVEAGTRIALLPLPSEGTAPAGVL